MRWCLLKGVVPLPKSVTPSRIAQNLDVFGFTVDGSDMAAIESMDEFGGSGLHPGEVDF